MANMNKSLIEGLSSIGEGRRLYIPVNLRNLQNGLWSSERKQWKFYKIIRAKKAGILFCPLDYWPPREAPPETCAIHNDSSLYNLSEMSVEGKIDHQWRIVLPPDLMMCAGIREYDRVSVVVSGAGIEVWDIDNWRKLKYGYCNMTGYNCSREENQFYISKGDIFCRSRSVVTQRIKECFGRWRTSGNTRIVEFCILEFPTKCFLLTPDFLGVKSFSFNRIEKSLRFCDRFMELSVPRMIESVKLLGNEASVTFWEIHGHQCGSWSRYEEPSPMRSVIANFVKLVDGVYVLRELLVE